MPADRILRRVRTELRLSGTAAWRGFVELINSNDLTHSASIAYYALLSLFPFLLLILSLLGAVTADEHDRVAVLDFVFRYFPTQLDFVTNQLDAFRAARVQIGIGGLLALVWGSLGVFGAVTSAVNEAWGVEKQRSFLKHRLVSFLMLVAAGGVMMVALMIVSLVEVVERSRFGAIVTNIRGMYVVQTLGFQYLGTVLVIIAVGLVFYFIPNAKTRFRDVWVGAILTGVLWRLAFDGFSWYIGRNTGMRMIHGSVAAILGFLLWIYVSSIILMYGVEFTAAYARMRRRRPDDVPAAQSPRV
ncbi:MAG TPA: YihY/virulence factor BrkB family protein [Vicinamibacterales bacterium]